MRYVLGALALTIAILIYQRKQTEQELIETHLKLVQARIDAWKEACK